MTLLAHMPYHIIEAIVLVSPGVAQDCGRPPPTPQSHTPGGSHVLEEKIDDDTKENLRIQEQSRNALRKIKEIFGLSRDTPPRVNVALGFRRTPENPRPSQEGVKPEVGAAPTNPPRNELGKASREP